MILYGIYTVLYDFIWMLYGFYRDFMDGFVGFYLVHVVYVGHNIRFSRVQVGFMWGFIMLFGFIRSFRGVIRVLPERYTVLGVVFGGLVVLWLVCKFEGFQDVSFSGFGLLNFQTVGGSSVHPKHVPFWE